MEVKDKDEVHKASYRCTGCQYQYDAMEMDKIFDPVTQELFCWRCQQIVEPDETAGPTDGTRQIFFLVFSLFSLYCHFLIGNQKNTYLHISNDRY